MTTVKIPRKGIFEIVICFRNLYKTELIYKNVLSESLLHLLLWLIFRQMHPNFINVRTAYASKLRAHLTKNLLNKIKYKKDSESTSKSEGRFLYEDYIYRGNS